VGVESQKERETIVARTSVYFRAWVHVHRHIQYYAAPNIGRDAISYRTHFGAVNLFGMIPGIFVPSMTVSLHRSPCAGTYGELNPEMSIYIHCSADLQSVRKLRGDLMIWS